MSTTVRPPATDLPVLTHITAENLPNTGRYTTAIAEYVGLAGAQVFRIAAADIPGKAIAFLWIEPDIAPAVVVSDELDDKGVEDAVFNLFIRWTRREPGQYATQWDGVDVVGIQVRDGGPR
ncbi:hypothetical protein OG216_23640 [Streptomycetaceae bacterium NBC_01309]